MTSADIRKAFLDFFKTKDHHIVPSSPIVVKNDPTLMAIALTLTLTHTVNISIGNTPHAQDSYAANPNASYGRIWW